MIIGLEDLMKNTRIANVVLALSAGIFLTALTFLIINTLNNPNGFFGSIDRQEELIIEEYLYYDIGSDSAKLYINIEDSTSEITVTCKPEDGPAKKFESNDNEFVLNNLTPDTSYSCSVTFSSELASGSQAIGVFTTKSKDYLNINNMKADAYDVSFNVVFRASWESKATSYLITKSLLGDESKVISQQEVVLYEPTYLDNILEIGKQYQYEIRSISGSTLGEPAIFNFKVEANQRLEDIVPTDKSNSVRILEPNFIFNENFESKTNVTTYSEIPIEKYEGYVFLSNGLPIFVDNISGLEGLILAGKIGADKKFKPNTLYEIPITREIQIKSAELKGKELKINFNYKVDEILYYSPDGVLHKAGVDELSSIATLDYEHPYINIKMNNFFIKINQSSPDSNITYDSDSGVISWSAASHFKSFILIASSLEGKEVYRVATGSPKYTIDILPNLDKVNIEIIGYPDLGAPKSLGKQIIKLPESTSSISLKSLTLEKAGSSLALEWDGDIRNEYEIQISPRNGASWQTIFTVPEGNTSYILPDIIKLNTGNYDLRVMPKRKNVLGKAYTYECYLKIDKNVNYQIICE